MGQKGVSHFALHMQMRARYFEAQATREAERLLRRIRGLGDANTSGSTARAKG